MKTNNFFSKAAIGVLLVIGIVMIASQAYAELKIDSVYPTMGIKGKDLSVTIKGSGFDTNTKISVSLDSGNNKAILGSANIPTRKVVVSGSIAYVSDVSGFKMIDISNPVSPKIIGSLDNDKLGTLDDTILLSDSKLYAYITGAYLYIPFLKVIDVSDPKNPSVVGKIDFNFYSFRHIIGSYGSIVYLSDGTIVDVSKPSNPTIIGALGTEISVVSDYKAYGMQGGRLTVTDVSVPSSPKSLGNISIDEIDSLMTYGGKIKAISDSRLYITYSDCGGWDKPAKLWILDVSKLSSPIPVGIVELKDCVGGVTVSGNTAFVANGMNGLQIIDVSNLLSPKVIGSVKTPDYSFDVAVSGSTAYVADDLSGLQIIDISNISADNLIKVKTPNVVNDVAISGSVAYVQERDNSLIYITDLQTYKIINTLKMPDVVKSIIVSGPALYVTMYDYDYDRNYSLQVWDISNLSSPTFIRSMGDISGIKFLLSDSKAYGDYYNYDSYIKSDLLIDISNPLLPKVINTFPAEDIPSLFVVSGSFGYKTSGDCVYGDLPGCSDLVILDMTNSINPQTLSTLKPTGEGLLNWTTISSLAVSGNFVYAACPLESLLKVIDVSNR